MATPRAADYGGTSKACDGVRERAEALLEEEERRAEERALRRQAVGTISDARPVLRMSRERFKKWYDLADMCVATQETREKWLDAYAETGNAVDACDIAGVLLASETLYRKLNAGWRNLVAHAHAQYVAKLHATTEARAMAGSDPLLVVLLKAHDPQRFSDKHRLDVVRTDEVQHTHVVKIDVDKLTPEQLAAYRVLMGAQPGAAARALVTGEDESTKRGAPAATRGNVIDVASTEKVGLSSEQDALRSAAEARGNVFDVGKEAT